MAYMLKEIPSCFLVGIQGRHITKHSRLGFGVLEFLM